MRLVIADDLSAPKGLWVCHPPLALTAGVSKVAVAKSLDENIY